MKESHVNMNINDAKGTAVVLTDNLYKTKSAKTAHGLVRGSTRFKVIGIVDAPTAGSDAGDTLDGSYRDIPTYFSIEQALERNPLPDYAVIGVATPGGILPKGLIKEVKYCLSKGVAVVNGLHDLLSNHEEIVHLAKAHNTAVYDIRKPKNYADNNFWSPNIYDLTTPVVAVMGTDCAVGKRTTCGLLHQLCNDAGIKAEMIYTGQTGWMQGYKYGFILDSTLNDFVSGELCHAVLSAVANEQPDIVLMEGQASLRNPSGPCGAEYLVSANAKKVILVHEEKDFYHDEPSWGKIKSLESEITLIEAYDAEVIGICLNTCELNEIQAKQKVETYKKKYNLPVVAPLIEGVTGLLPVIKNIL